MKRLRMALILAAAVLGISGSMAVKTEAKGKTTKAWAKAYLQIAETYNKEDEEYKAKGSFLYSPYKYALVYFDKDDIPEFVVGNNGYWVSMYTYNKKTKKAVLLMDRWAYGAMGNHGYEYLPKKSILYNQNSDFAGCVVKHCVLTLKKGKLVAKYSKSLTEKHFIDKNNNGYPDDGEYITKTRYYYGDKKISAKKFKSYIPKGSYKFLTGKKSFEKIKKILAKK